MEELEEDVWKWGTPLIFQLGFGLLAIEITASTVKLLIQFLRISDCLCCAVADVVRDQHCVGNLACGLR